MRLKDLFKKKEKDLTLEEQVERTKTLEEAEDLGIYHVLDTFGGLCSDISYYKNQTERKSKVNPKEKHSIDIFNGCISQTKDFVTISFTCILAETAFILDYSRHSRKSG